MMTKTEASTTAANEEPQSIVSPGSKPPTSRKDGTASRKKEGSSPLRNHDHDKDTATMLPLQVILLVVDPLTDHHETSSEFELFQVQVLHSATTVGDILNQIQRLVNQKMQSQTHKGVLLLLPQLPPPPPTPNNKKQPSEQQSVPTKVAPQPPAALLFSKNVLLQKLVTPLSLPNQHLRGILLVALPDTVSVSECAQEARTVLQDTSVHQLLVRIAQSVCTWLSSR